MMMDACGGDVVAGTEEEVSSPPFMMMKSLPWHYCPKFGICT